MQQCPSFGCEGRRARRRQPRVIPASRPKERRQPCRKAKARMLTTEARIQARGADGVDRRR
jgi:hypothetical protein